MIQKTKGVQTYKNNLWHSNQFYKFKSLKNQTLQKLILWVIKIGICNTFGLQKIYRSVWNISASIRSSSKKAIIA